jgi:hypothetical protein
LDDRLSQGNFAFSTIKELGHQNPTIIAPGLHFFGELYQINLQEPLTLLRRIRSMFQNE